MTTAKHLPLAALAAIAALIATVTPGPSTAQELCLVRDDAIQQLAQRHGEQVTARGLAQNGRAMVELLKSETGSWTLVVTDVHGQSCIVASGEAWSEITREPGTPS